MAGGFCPHFCPLLADRQSVGPTSRFCNRARLQSCRKTVGAKRPPRSILRDAPAPRGALAGSNPGPLAPGAIRTEIRLFIRYSRGYYHYGLQQGPRSRRPERAARHPGKRLPGSARQTKPIRDIAGSPGMNHRAVIVAAAAFLLAASLGTTAAQQNTPTPPQQLNVTIDTQQTAPPVSPYEYGMFIEHIGQLIYRSLWSEMLDDRKFYFPIKPEEPQAAAPAQGGPFRNMQLRKWRPIGPARSHRDGQGPPLRRRPEPAHRPRRLHSARHPPVRLRPGQQQEVHRPHLAPRHTRREGEDRARLGSRAPATARPSPCPRPRPPTKNSPSPLPPRPTPMPAPSRSPAPARAASTSAPSRSCPPITSTASAPKSSRSSSPCTPASGASPAATTSPTSTGMTPSARAIKPPARLRLRLERHADQRRRHGRVHDVLQTASASSPTSPSTPVSATPTPPPKKSSTSTAPPAHPWARCAHATATPSRIT